MSDLFVSSPYKIINCIEGTLVVIDYHFARYDIFADAIEKHQRNSAFEHILKVVAGFCVLRDGNNNARNTLMHKHVRVNDFSFKTFIRLTENYCVARLVSNIFYSADRRGEEVVFDFRDDDTDDCRSTAL